MSLKASEARKLFGTHFEVSFNFPEDGVNIVMEVLGNPELNYNEFDTAEEAVAYLRSSEKRRLEQANQGYNQARRKLRSIIILSRYKFGLLSLEKMEEIKEWLEKVEQTTQKLKEVDTEEYEVRYLADELEMGSVP